ncbi:MAG: hypothetical protein SFY67_12640 [Candidatus Melainabacteria bacterium]|nr:hypothetical protein [Candidatus Melainabacteria bacterium]
MENQEKPCKHEYVRIFQRKLKGLERRLVAQKAFLPVGFKIGDFQHLGENSYCFCSKCRARLYPKRSAAEKELARQERLKQRMEKLSPAAGLLDPDIELDSELDSEDEKELPDIDQDPDDEEKDSDVNIHVEEMDVELVGVEDIVKEGVKLSADDEDGQCAVDDEDLD